MTAIQFLVAALATWQAVEIWRHGSIFARARARLEISSSWTSTLLLCPFCLSTWVATLAAFLLSGMPHWWYVWSQRTPDVSLTTVAVCQLLWGLGYAVWLFVHGLAIARLANLGNDLTHAWCRTPGRTREPDIFLKDFFKTWTVPAEEPAPTSNPIENSNAESDTLYSRRRF